MAKFRNPETNEIIELLTHKISYVDGKKIYKDKNNKELKTESGLSFELIDERDPNRPIEAPTFLKFDGASGSVKQGILKQRSLQDFKKNVEEKKMHDQQNAMNQLKNIVNKKN